MQCENLVLLSGPEEEVALFMKDFVVDTIYGEQISFQRIRPVPGCFDLEHAQVWKETNWGIPFDPSNFIFTSEKNLNIGFRTISIRFDTVALPPIPIYQKLLSLRPCLNLTAYYCNEFGKCAGYFGRINILHYEGDVYSKEINGIGRKYFGWYENRNGQQ